ncbi:MAG: hypothetical protein ACLFQB_11515 [Chitinispirillaceae bacterium]
MIRRSIMTAAVVGFLVFQAKAARPFTVDDAGTVSKEGFEVEVASNYWGDAFDGGIGLKHGLTDRMDFGIGFGYTALPETDAQHSPLEIGMKYALVPDMLAASLGASLGDPGYAVNLVASRPLGAASLHLNLGLETMSSVDQRAVTYGIAASFETGRVTSGFEIAGADDSIDWWQIGAQVSVLEWLAVDGGLGGDFKKDISMTATSGIWMEF